MVLLTIFLFAIFSLIDVNVSISIVLFLIYLLVGIRIFEIVMFYNVKKKLIKLGEKELFTSKIWGILAALISIIFIYLSIKYSYLLEYEANEFNAYFWSSTKNSTTNFIIVLSFFIRSLIDDNRIFYLTQQGIITHGDYFEEYLWKDFKGFKVIEEQSLIRFTKKNDKFLFVKYKEPYFQENKKEVLSILNKNIPYV